MTPTPTPLDTSVAFRKRARYVVVLVTLTLVGLWVGWRARQALLLGFLGVALGVLFYRASRWLAARLGAPRGVMLALVILGVVGSVAAAAALVGPTLVGEARALIEAGPELIARARAQLGIPDDALVLPSSGTGMASRALGVFSSVAGGLASLVVVLIVAIYTAAEPRRYTDGVVRFVDREHQPFVRSVLDDVEEVLVSWLKGVGIAVAALGTMALVGLSIIGLPGAVALAAFAAALTVIPTFGPLLGWAPAIVVGFAQGTTPGLWTLGLAVVAQQIEGSVITPKVQGAMVSVGPALIVAGQIVLGTLAGFLGVLLVVPILGVGLVLVRRLYIGPFVDGEGPKPAGSSEEDASAHRASPEAVPAPT
ncbi:MAG: AI-2E family transporter [Bacteroidota bacterium]